MIPIFMLNATVASFSQATNGQHRGFLEEKASKRGRYRRLAAQQVWSSLATFFNLLVTQEPWRRWCRGKLSERTRRSWSWKTKRLCKPINASTCKAICYFYVSGEPDICISIGRYYTCPLPLLVSTIWNWFSDTYFVSALTPL